MPSSNSYLKKCEKLSCAGFSPELEAGMIIGRGFADLGYEEFVLLRSDLMASLYTGKTAQLAAEERDKFFCVPDCDRLIDALLRRGYDISGLDFKAQREWQLKITNPSNKATTSIAAPSLQEVLIDGLLTTFD